MSSKATIFSCFILERENITFTWLAVISAQATNEVQLAFSFVKVMPCQPKTDVLFSFAFSFSFSFRYSTLAVITLRVCVCVHAYSPVKIKSDKAFPSQKGENLLYAMKSLGDS